MASKIMSETFYGRREPQWLLERPKEQHSHFDQRGCVRQIKSVSHRRHTENDLPASRSRAGSYFPEQQPSLTADHRQAVTVYNALPSVTHRTASNTSFSVPIVEFSVPLCCGKCEEKVKEELENDEGVYKVVCDLHNQRVTVSSSRDPNWLLRRIKRMKKNSHFWRGNTHFKDAHYLATSFPSPGLKSLAGHHHHSQELSSQPIDIPASAYREIESALPHHRASPQRHLNQSYHVAPAGSPIYDDDRREYYYPRESEAEYQYKSSIASPYDTSYDAQMYADATAVSFRDSLSHSHLASSYGQPYVTEDYAPHLNHGYY